MQTHLAARVISTEYVSWINSALGCQFGPFYPGIFRERAARCEARLTVWLNESFVSDWNLNLEFFRCLSKLRFRTRCFANWNMNLCLCPLSTSAFILSAGARKGRLYLLKWFVSLGSNNGFGLRAVQTRPSAWREIEERRNDCFLCILMLCTSCARGDEG